MNITVVQVRVSLFTRNMADETADCHPTSLMSITRDIIVSNKSNRKK